ncbi:hypothetical protein KFU94_31265, partial [Chloroflexi bacterium TSY]|nr:hypothetical protein [Chloroflexi bacterium TSY]
WMFKRMVVACVMNQEDGAGAQAIWDNDGRVGGVEVVAVVVWDHACGDGEYGSVLETDLQCVA